jgi:hypothetical protein
MHRVLEHPNTRSITLIGTRYASGAASAATALRERSCASLTREQRLGVDERANPSWTSRCASSSPHSRDGTARRAVGELRCCKRTPASQRRRQAEETHMT